MGLFLDRARLLFRQARYDLAERELRQELSSEPNNADAHALLGLCFHHLQRPEEALKACREAVRLAPASAYPHCTLAYVLDDQNQLDEADTCITEAIRLAPHVPYYHGLRSYICLRRRRYEEGLIAAEAGLQLDARNVYCLNRRAMALGNLDRLEEAEQVARTALSINPEDAISLSILGWIVLRRRQPASALEHFHQSLRVDPQLGWTRQNTIDALVALIEGKEYRLADQWFTEALQRDPQLEEGRQRLWQALLKPLGESVDFAVRTIWVVTFLFAVIALPWTPFTVMAALAVCTGAMALPENGSVLGEPVAWLLAGMRQLGRRLRSEEQTRACRAAGLALLVGPSLVAVAFACEPGPMRVLAVCLLSLILPLLAWCRWFDPALRRGLQIGATVLCFTGAYLTTLSAVDLAPRDLISQGAAVQLIVSVWGTEAVGLFARRQMKRT